MSNDKITARIVLDSLNSRLPGRVHRLTTLVVTFPRFILAELNTHRAFSRNSASSRAIPLRRQLELLLRESFVPSPWTRNQPGMQASEVETDPGVIVQNDAAWLDSMLCARDAVSALELSGVHKQHAARLLEPFMFHEVVISSTDWANFFAQRPTPMAQPEMRELAEKMRDAYLASEPTERSFHAPFVTPELDPALSAAEAYGLVGRDAVARAARVSYGRTDTGTTEENNALTERLAASRHWSPFEHVAAAMPPEDAHLFERPVLRWRGWKPEPVPGKFTYYCGNFNGWIQARKIHDGEDGGEHMADA